MAVAPETASTKSPFGVSIGRRIRLPHLLGMMVLYGAWLWWIHYLVRSPFNVDYFTQYVQMRCSAEQFARFGHPASREKSIELRDALQRCEGAQVSVDGVWGGIVGSPSVRLLVRYPDDDSGAARAELKYYSVDVSPVAGIASIEYTLSPSLYYVNF